ncbi:MAG TPA: hypothetical protein DEQ61_23600 [Streptomyces sp.]|nr:hypothetical protein [Streptomyces sp.]
MSEPSRTSTSWSLYTSTDIPALIDRINRLQARVDELESAACESRPVDDDPIAYSLTATGVGALLAAQLQNGGQR